MKRFYYILTFYFKCLLIIQQSKQCEPHIFLNLILSNVLLFLANYWPVKATATSKSRSRMQNAPRTRPVTQKKLFEVLVVFNYYYHNFTGMTCLLI